MRPADRCRFVGESVDGPGLIAGGTEVARMLLEVDPPAAD